jgi:serine protease Do
MRTREIWSKRIQNDEQNGNRSLLPGLALTGALLLAVAGLSRGQEAPKPPAPPEPQEPSEVFVLGGNSAHLGVTLSDVTPEKAQELKLPTVAGAIVNSVQKESAAAKAGIEAGDVILEFDGVHVRSSAELRRLIRETPPGRAVVIKIARNGKTTTLNAELTPSDNSFNFNMPEIRLPRMEEIPPAYGPHHVTLGISGTDLTPQLAQYFGVKQGKGVLITEVTRGGAADKAGLKAGDVIVQLDGKTISSVEELRFTLNHFLDDPHKAAVTIVREHREQTVHADLSHFKTWEEQTTSATQTSELQGRVNAKANAEQLQATADELRDLGERQRAIVQAEVFKQRQYLNTEWQRQIQEQAKTLKEQLRQMPTLPLVLHPNDEI